MSPQQLRAVVPIMVLLGIGSSSCSSEGPLPVGGSERGDPPAEQGEALHYFCVDHPCADLHPKKIRECYRLGNTMRIDIENIGLINAGPSKAKFWVDWYGYSRTYDVPAIDAGAPPYGLYVTLPAECLGLKGSPGCSWGLLADATNIVGETNGSNNTTAGACIY